MVAKQVKKIGQKAKEVSTILGETVLVKRIKSSTPKGWKITGEICTISAGASLLAWGLTPPGWITYATIGLLVLSSSLGTWAGYQTNDPELKKLWMKPFSLLRKKKVN